MLIAALVLALLGFISFVVFVDSGQTWALVAMFICVGAGVVALVWDIISKARDRR